MKTVYAAGFHLVFANLLSAQPTIHQADFTPVVGTSYTLENCAYLPPGPSGANQTWNFAAASSSSQGIYMAVDPATAPEADTYPSANLCWYLEPTVYRFAELSATGLTELGTTLAGLGNSVYSDPMKTIQLPLTYNTSWSDSYAGTSVVLGNTTTFNGNLTCTGDGYGTLITPSATYANVLRIHRERNEVRVTNGVTTTVEHTTWFWLKTGTPYPVAQISEVSSTVNGNTTTDETLDYVSSGVGVEEAAHTSILLQASPNPASDQLTLTIADRMEITTITVMDAAGRPVLAHAVLPGSTTHLLDIRALSAGTYYVSCADRQSVRAWSRFTKH